MKQKVLMGLLVSTILLAGCQSQQPSTQSYGQGNAQSPTVNINQSNNLPMQLQPAKSGDTIATLDTSKGVIKIKLFTEQVPETTKNFMELARAGKYDGVPFHRVIEDFMIQTGDFTRQNGTGGHSYKGPDTTIDDEFSEDLRHYPGAVSMANAGPDTNGSQFFIVTAASGTPHLDNRHSVFGQVIEGQAVAEAISRVPTSPGDRPLEPLLIKKVTISTLE